MYVEEFTQPSIASSTLKPSNAMPSDVNDYSKLLRYHGLAAINATIFPTWDAYFSDLLQQPEETYRIVSEKTHVPDYDIDIKPASLCSRIISVREQIAREFERDLGVFATMGGNNLDSHWAKIKEQRDEANDSGIDDDIRLQRESLLILDYVISEDDYTPSPLRKGNFDLLVLLSTQEAIHRVLNDHGRREGDEKAANSFLQQFYVDRFVSHFSGSQRYGRADDFLEELLSQTPRFITLKQDSKEVTYLVDPTDVAELILEQRALVALEWKELCANIPQLHMNIKRMQLDLLTGKSTECGSNEESGEGFQ